MPTNESVIRRRIRQIERYIKQEIQQERILDQYNRLLKRRGEHLTPARKQNIINSFNALHNRRMALSPVLRNINYRMRAVSPKTRKSLLLAMPKKVYPLQY